MADPPESATFRAFRKVVGDETADKIKALMNKNRIDSVGRAAEEHQRQQPKPNPPKDLSDEWWNK